MRPRAEHGALDPLVVELGPSRATSARDGRRTAERRPVLARAGGGGEAEGRAARGERWVAHGIAEW
jgi:hypothetical protein